MADYRTIITTAGQAKLAAAILGPAIVLETMAIGDASGVGYDPDEEQTALVNQVYTASLDSVETLAGGVIVCELTIPADQGGWHVREACIKDNTGAIIAIARIADRYKPLPASGQADELTIRMKLDVGNVTWAVDLTRKAKIDGQLRPDFRSVERVENDPQVAVAGETWIVGLAPTGAWVGHENELAEWSGSGWTFAAPTKWMLVGFADRTDWRWDHTLGTPAWVEWKATQTRRGPVELATPAEIIAGVDDERAITPNGLYQGIGAYIGGGNLTLWVRPGGNDANDGSANTDGKAFATVIGAINWASAKYGSARPITINLGAPGAWVAPNNFPLGCNIRIYGDPAAMNSYALTNSGGAARSLIALSGGYLSFEGLSFSNYHAGVHGLDAVVNGQLDVGNCRFAPNVSFSSCIRAAYGAQVRIFNDMTFGSNASNAMLAINGGNINSVVGATLTFFGSPSFANATVNATNCGTLNCGGSVFAGTAGGTRYYAGRNGVIDTAGGGASFIPGSVGGVTATGGLYV